MDNKIAETLEMLEEKIEGIKWWVSVSSSLKKADISEAINLVRKSAGVLGKDFPKGTTFENKARRGWKTNSIKRLG